MSFMVLGQEQQQRQRQWGNGDGDDRSIAIAMAPGQGHWGNCNSNGATGQEQKEQGHWGNCNSNGATGQEQQEQGHWGNSNRTVLQQHWGRGHRTVIAMGQCQSIVFRSCCNGEGATETPAIDESIAMAPGQGHRALGEEQQNSVATEQ
jgi:hypothetical protein